jgi:hypothetical protein
MARKKKPDPRPKLSDEVLLKAGHPLYCSEYADEFEAHGGSFGAGAEITLCVDEAPKDKLLVIMRKYEESLSKAWKCAAVQVFDLMGVPANEQDDALYLVLMSCRGHGIGLRDDHKDWIDKYEEATGQELKTAPFYTEMTELNELALEKLEVPNEEWGVFFTDPEGKSEKTLIEGRFWDEESAEKWLRDGSFGSDPGYTVEEVEHE